MLHSLFQPRLPLEHLVVDPEAVGGLSLALLNHWLGQSVQRIQCEFSLACPSEINRIPRVQMSITRRSLSWSIHASFTISQLH